MIFPKLHTLSEKPKGEKQMENDTVKLLRECDAGVKMGVASIDEVLDCVTLQELEDYLIDCKSKHKTLEEEIRQELCELDEVGKKPSPMAKSMSWLKTNVKMMAKKTDATVADLMIDGCDMGVKSLSRYLNQYPTADAKAKELATRLVSLEEEMSKHLRAYL
jgi:hypothetical protein